jgi:hypothetical protein
MTPVTRTDKTGKTVIRHMNLAGKGSETKAIPKPVAAAPRSRRERSIQTLTKRIVALVGRETAWGVIPSNVLKVKDWTDRLEKLSDETVAGFHELLNSSNKKGVVELLASALASYDEDADQIGNFMVATKYETDRSRDWASHESRALLRADRAYGGLDHYSALGFESPRSVLDAPEPVKSQAMALLQTLSTADGVGSISGKGVVMNMTSGSTHLVLPLAKLVIDRYEDVDRICEIMRDRQTVEPDLIESILDTAAPALSEGIL